jgi:hypothetical protein
LRECTDIPRIELRLILEIDGDVDDQFAEHA